MYAKLAEGATFEELIDEYDEDPGMTGDSVGYPVCAESTNWVAEFQEGAMALANVGDVSAEPVRTSYGLHIIKYDSDIAEGEIGLETVKADIYDELLSAEQEEVYNSTVEQWVNEANAKVYKNRL